MTVTQSNLEPIANCVLDVNSWNPQKDGGDSEINYIDLSSINQVTKRIESHSIIAAQDAPSRARQLVRKGDILVSTVRPNLNGVAVVPDALDGATASTGFCVLRPNPKKVNGAYLFHWVKSRGFISEMTRKATGASYPAVSDRIICDSLVPLPSIPDQQRIATTLDQADVLLAKRRLALGKLESFAQSLFLEMFGDPILNPKHWPGDKLENLCEAINDCPHSTPEWTSSGEICLRTSNLTAGGWDWADKRFVARATFEERSQRGYLNPGDIVLSREGTVGVAAIVYPGLRACMGQRLVQVRSSLAHVEPHYLLMYLLHVLSPNRISRFMVGATSQHLNVKALRALYVPVPTLRLQREFSVMKNIIDRIKNAQQDSNAKFDTLFASLQHRAFKGEL